MTKDNPDELLRCPFCDGAAEIKDRLQTRRTHYSAHIFYGVRAWNPRQTTQKPSIKDCIKVDYYGTLSVEPKDLVEMGPTFCSIVDFKIEYCGQKETIKESYES